MWEKVKCWFQGYGKEQFEIQNWCLVTKGKLGFEVWTNLGWESCSIPTWRYWMHEFGMYVFCLDIQILLFSAHMWCQSHVTKMDTWGIWYKWRNHLRTIRAYTVRGAVAKKSGKSTSNYLNDEGNYVIIFGSELDSKDEPL